MKFDLVYFTKRVPDTNNKSATRATRVRQKRQERDTNNTGATGVLHERFRFW